jgi:uncharacterized protein (DUF4213/DUF364 family)
MTGRSNEKMIIEQTIKLLKSRYSGRIETLSIADVRIGISMTAVKLSDGSCGVSSTFTNETQHSRKGNRDYGDFSPLKIRGHKVIELLETEKSSGIITTLRIACLNAISSQIVSAGSYNILENRDPIDLFDLSIPRTITIVGAFHSYISKISGTQNRLYVLELNENEIGPDERQFFVPAGEYKRVLPESDIVIITGLTLVNNTIDELLESVPGKSVVVVAGPSGSIIPDVLFANGVSIIGATRITKPDVLFDLISEGGGGYHLFEYCAQKICILRDYEA